MSQAAETLIKSHPSDDSCVLEVVVSVDIHRSAKDRVVWRRGDSKQWRNLWYNNPKNAFILEITCARALLSGYRCVQSNYLLICATNISYYTPPLAIFMVLTSKRIPCRAVEHMYTCMYDFTCICTYTYTHTNISLDLINSSGTFYFGINSPWLYLFILKLYINTSSL